MRRCVSILLVCILSMTALFAGCASKDTDNGKADDTQTSAAVSASSEPTGASQETAADSEPAEASPATEPAEASAETQPEAPDSVIGQTFELKQLFLTVDGIEVIEGANSYVAVEVTLENKNTSGDFKIGNSGCAITDKDGQTIDNWSFDVGDYTNILNTTVVHGEKASGYLLIADVENGPFTLTFPGKDAPVNIVIPYGEDGDTAGAAIPESASASDSVIGQTVTFRSLDITFNSAEVVKAKGNVLAINVTIVNNGDAAACIGAGRTKLVDSTGEQKSQYGFDVDDMIYILDTEVAPGETLTGYLIYYAPDSSPATLTLDNSYENEDEILDLIIAF